MDAESRTTTIVFDPPLKFGDKTVSEVPLREPTGQEYVAAQERPGLGATLALIQSIGKLTGPIVSQIPVSKVMEADAFFARVIRSAPARAPEPEGPQPGDDVLFASLLERLREPTIAELDAAGAGPVGTARLIAATTGLPLATALRAPISLLYAADAYFAGFATPSPATSTT